MRRTRHLSLALVTLSTLCWAGCEHKLRRPTNYPCASDDQCVSGVCHADICVAASPAGLGAACTDHGDCRSLRCADGKCGGGVRSGGEACRFHDECKSGRCHKDSTCDVDTSPDAGPDGPRPDGARPDGARPDCPRPDAPRDKGPGPEKGVDKGKEKEKDKAAPKPEQGQPDLPVKPKDKGQPDLPVKPKDKGQPDVPQVVDKALPKDSVLLPDLPAKPKAIKRLDSVALKIAVTKGIDELSPAVATGNGKWLGVWQDNRDGNPNIYGAHIPPDPYKPFKAFQITNTAGVQEKFPAVAFTGASYLVAWWVWGTTTSKVQARVVKPQAAKVTTPILTLQSKSGTSAPAVACGGATCLVVWSENTHIAGALVNAGGNGALTKTVTVNQAPGTHASPAVAFGGGGFLVVWQKTTDADGGFTDQDIFAARVDLAGTPDKKATTLANDLNRNEVNPAVAHGGGKFLVVWQAGPLTPSTTSHIRAGALDAKKALAKPASVITVASSNTVKHPAVAHDKYSFLVVYSEQQVGCTVIKGKEVPNGGGLAKPLPSAPTITTLACSGGSGNLLNPAVAGWAWRFIVLSQEGGNDVYGTRLSRVY